MCTCIIHICVLQCQEKCAMCNQKKKKNLQTKKGDIRGQGWIYFWHFTARRTNKRLAWLDSLTTLHVIASFILLCFYLYTEIANTLLEICNIQSLKFSYPYLVVILREDGRSYSERSSPGMVGQIRSWAPPEGAKIHQHGIKTENYSSYQGVS